MYCIECGSVLPNPRTSSTVCSTCKTPVATWWDEDSQTPRTHREALIVAPESGSGIVGRRRNNQSIEERSFQAVLICLEQHFEKKAGLGPKTLPDVKAMIKTTLDQSLNKADVREKLAKNVDIWMRLRKIFMLAVRTLEKSSLREAYQDSNGMTAAHEIPENSTLILRHYDELVTDLQFLNNLLVISRNMLAIKEIAQEICAAVYFDKAVHELMILCVNVTSKGYDGENVDELNRAKLNEVTDLYKKLLVTSLQHTHNWTMGNDRFKMKFWWDMLFDDDLRNDAVQELPPDNLDVQKVFDEVKNWLERHSEGEKRATELLDKYSADVALGNTPGPLHRRRILLSGTEPDKPRRTDESTTPIWMPEMEDKYEQDRLYARVSHEIDVWWKRVRDANYEGWVVPMESVEGAIARTESCKANAMNRYMHGDDQKYDDEEAYDEQTEDDEGGEEDEIDDRSTAGEHGDDEADDEEEEEDDDDESYAEGPLRGLLTEIPNILDTKQIEALHMTVKACVVDSMGSGLTPAGENLQKTRCKMFLALDCGKNLLREMLVFIAVWEQNDQQFIFQITAQIIESFHHNALLPYAWNSLRIMKDIVSPAQTVLLRLINYMFRARKDSPIYDDVRDYNRDAKLIHFLYNYFRCRVVPDCIALIHAQAEIRQDKRLPGDFPVDLWDMERAKDGLSQYLDFISVIAEIQEMRHLLVDWEATYELVALLKALEAGVARKSLDDRQMPSNYRGAPAGSTAGGQYANAPANAPHPNIPPMHDTPHKFPWAGIKIQILIILTSLVAPTNARRNGPGNPIVQKQLLEREGIMPLLNCCVYDGHNEYLKERATLAIKFVMEGCEEAQKYVRDLVPVKQAQAAQAQQVQAQAQAQLNALNAQAEAISALPAHTQSLLNSIPAPLASLSAAEQAYNFAQQRALMQAREAHEASTRAESVPTQFTYSAPSPMLAKAKAAAAAMKAKYEAQSSQQGRDAAMIQAADEVERKTQQLKDAGVLAEQGKTILEEAKEMMMAQARGVDFDPVAVEKMAQRVQGLKIGGEKHQIQNQSQNQTQPRPQLGESQSQSQSQNGKGKENERDSENTSPGKETKQQRKQRLMLEALDRGEGL